MPGMRRSRTAVVIGLLVVAGAGCSRGDSNSLPAPRPGFCEAASRYDREVERDATLDEQITILEKLERNAPEDVAEDAATFLDAMRRLRDGDRSVVDQPDIQQAVENVNRRAANDCGFFESEPGDGS
jgi:hypothetical protein